VVEVELFVLGYNKEVISAEDLATDTEYSVKYISRTVKIGYWFWAVPLVQYMTQSEKNNSWFGQLVIRVIRALAQARANELCYAMGVKKDRDALGIATRIIGESFCWIVGAIATPFVEKKFAKWLGVLCPGAGYLYAGQPKTALTSFLVNGLLIAASTQLFVSHLYTLGVVVATFEAGWYVGGILGGKED